MAARIPVLPSVSEIVRLYKLQARKHLSQNFLLDMNLTRKIIRCAGLSEQSSVCEVGPGPGGLTRAIMEKDICDLTVIEKDRRFLPGLRLLSEASAKPIRVVHGDVLSYDMQDTFPETYVHEWKGDSPNIHIIGNLPFNVSTPLIIKWLEAISKKTGPWRYGRTRLTLTFQKEVAERMVANIMSRQRCRLSVMCQHLCDVNLKMVIPGSAFVPAPKVDVGVVTFIPLKEPKIKLPFKLVEKVTRNIFQHRNKIIKRGVENLFPPHMAEELRDEMFKCSGLDPNCRSFMLTVEEFGYLCHIYSAICQRHPAVYDYDFRSSESQKILRMRKKQKVDNTDNLYD